MTGDGPSRVRPFLWTLLQFPGAVDLGKGAVRGASASSLDFAVTWGAPPRPGGLCAPCPPASACGYGLLLYLRAKASRPRRGSACGRAAEQAPLYRNHQPPEVAIKWAANHRTP